MKNRLASLALCLALALPCGAQAAYTPGQRTGEIVLDALTVNNRIAADLSLTADCDLSMLGLSDEEAALFSQVAAALSGAHLTGAFVPLEDALRLEIGASLDGNSSVPQGVSINGALEIGMDGVAVQTDLLPAERYTLSWESVLSYAGLSDSEITELLALRSMDWEAALASLMETLDMGLSILMPAVMPYGDTLAAWAAGLENEIVSPVEPVEGYPDTASELYCYVTASDMGDLFASLSAQFRADETLLPMADSLLQEYLGVTAVELCDELDALAASLKQDDSEEFLMICVGLDEDSAPIYLEIQPFVDDAPLAYFGLFGYETIIPGSYVFELHSYTLDDALDPVDGLYLILDLAADPADPNAFSYDCEIQAFAGGESLMTQMQQVSSSSYTSDNGLPGVKVTTAITQDQELDGSAFAFSVDAESDRLLTADGGESSSSSQLCEVALDGAPLMHLRLDTSSSINAPVPGTFEGVGEMNLTIPEFGINNISAHAAFSALPYTAEPAEDIALDTASSEDLESLMARLQNAGMSRLFAAMSLLPPDLLGMLMQ